MDKIKELYAFEEEIYHYNLNEAAYIAKVSEMVDFIYDNFQEIDELNSGYYSQKFEIELAKTSRLICHIYHCSPFNMPLKKSDKIKSLILDIATNPKYKNARADFLKEVANIWVKDFIQLALKDELWCSDLIKLELLSALNQKRIGGFADKAQAVLETEQDTKSELYKIATRYLKNEVKFKHYREKL